MTTPRGGSAVHAGTAFRRQKLLQQSEAERVAATACPIGELGVIADCKRARYRFESAGCNGARCPTAGITGTRPAAGVGERTPLQYNMQKS
jgi:hypothetical protein